MRNTIISLVLALGVALPAHSDTLKLRADAPGRYTVVKGDTLWGISGRYLNSPWQWPKLWQMNRAEVKNPHWIYPGDVLALHYVNGQPRLSLEKSAPREVKLSPRMRPEDMGGAIASIPATAIEPFLGRPLVIEESDYLRAPQLVAGPEDRLTVSTGDKAYSNGVEQGGSWQAYRLGKKLVDPDSNEFLGYEAVYSGDLTVDKLAQPFQTLRVTRISSEVMVGDRLMRAPRQAFVNYVPHPAPEGVKGKILSNYGGLAGSAQYSTVVINRGGRDQLEPGSVLGVFKTGKMLSVHDEQGKKQQAQLPTEQAGKLFVYRVFDKVAYALVLDSKLPIYAGDLVAAPEDE